MTIFAANRGRDPFEKINAGQPEDGLITRPSFEVDVRRLARPVRAEFLSALIAGATLGVAAGAALQASRHSTSATRSPA